MENELKGPNTNTKLTPKDIWRRVLLHIPFVLLITFAVAFIGGGLLLVIYAIVAITATSSGMMFNLLFGSGTLAIGAGMFCIDGFIQYLAYYNEKEKFIARKKKSEIKKKPFSYQNICLYVALVGSICIIISAGLGSIQSDKWVEARASYMQENGYYTETQVFDTQYDTTDYNGVNKIVLNIEEKNVVVIYTSNDVFVRVKGYWKYQNQFETSRTTDGTLYITEMPSPDKNRTLEKMLSFFFDDNEAEAQIRVYIPLSQKDNIEIVGDYIIAKE